LFTLRIQFLKNWFPGNQILKYKQCRGTKFRLLKTEFSNVKSNVRNSLRIQLLRSRILDEVFQFLYQKLTKKKVKKELKYNQNSSLQKLNSNHFSHT